MEAIFRKTRPRSGAAALSRLMILAISAGRGDIPVILKG
jgi:hypothetical protein